MFRDSLPMLNSLNTADNSMDIQALREENKQLKTQVKNFGLRLHIVEGKFKEIAQLNYKMLLKMSLPMDEFSSQMQMLCQLDPENRDFRLHLVDSYFNSGELEKAYAAINYYEKWEINGEAEKMRCGLGAKICFELAEKAKTPIEKIQHLSSALQYLSNIEDMDELRQAVSKQACILYSQAAIALNERRVSSFLEALLLFKALNVLKPYLKASSLPEVRSIKDYPRRVPVENIREICRAIEEEYKKGYTLFSSSKKDKATWIEDSLHAAESALKDDSGCVELVKFLTYKQSNDDLSLLETLQYGRWFGSGAHVDSYQNFINKLNKLGGCLGDEVKELKQPKEMDEKLIV